MIQEATHCVCCWRSTYTSYSITDAFVPAGNQELNQKKAQIHTSASEHKPEAE